eukprot:1160590-Pelagomonas_calceolata.AAC.6
MLVYAVCSTRQHSQKCCSIPGTVHQTAANQKQPQQRTVRRKAAACCARCMVALSSRILTTHSGPHLSVAGLLRFLVQPPSNYGPKKNQHLNLLSLPPGVASSYAAVYAVQALTQALLIVTVTVSARDLPALFLLLRARSLCARPAGWAG